MKTSLALIVAATSVFVFTQAADAQCDCQQTVSYYAPAPTTAYYAPTTVYYGSDDCLLRSDHVLLRSDHCLLRSGHCLLRSDDCLLRSDHCLLSNFGVLRPNHGILRGQWLLRQWLLRRLLSRRIVRHWLGRLGRFSWNRPKVGSSRVVNGEDVAARGLRGIERRGMLAWLTSCAKNRSSTFSRSSHRQVRRLDGNRGELLSSATSCVFYILRERFVVIYLEQNIRISSIRAAVTRFLPRAPGHH